MPENDIQQIKNNLSSLRTASDQAKKSAQNAGRKIQDVEKNDFTRLFDKQFKDLARRTARSFGAALEGLILNGDSFKTTLKKIGADLIKNILASQSLGRVAPSILPFARGGVLNGPAVFPLNRGTGLAGEAGPEAIMPLARGSDGRLGVRAQNGGGRVNINVNIATPDIEGFRRTQTQIAGIVRRAVAHGQRNS